MHIAYQYLLQSVYDRAACMREDLRRASGELKGMQSLIGGAV